MTGQRLGDLVAGLTDVVLADARLSVHSGFDALAESWTAAMDHAAAYAFQTLEWQSAWAATVGKAEGVSVHLVHLAADDGRTLLILPLGIHRERRLRVLRFLGHVVTDYNAPLIDRDFAATLQARDVARLWAAIMALLPRTDLVWLRRMPGSIEGIANPLILLPRTLPSETAYAATLPASMAAFRGARSSSFFSQNRRRRRRLADRGSVSFPIARTREAALPMLAAMALFKSRQWRETGGRDLFANPGYLDFYDRLTTTPLIESGLVHVCGLTLDGQAAAAHWGLVFRGRFYLLMTGYEEAEWTRYSPGRLLLENLVEECIARGDIAVFDLTVGDEGYKRTWADHSLPLYEHVAARSMRGRLFLAAHGIRRRLKGWTLLRDLVRQLRRKAKEGKS